MRWLFGMALVGTACVPIGNQVPDPQAGPDPQTPPDLHAGAIHVDLGDGTSPATVSAVFLADAPAIANLAQCVGMPDVACFELPSTDEVYTVRAPIDLDPDALETQFVGFNIEVAGADLAFAEDDNGLGGVPRDAGGRPSYASRLGQRLVAGG